MFTFALWQKKYEETIKDASSSRNSRKIHAMKKLHKFPFFLPLNKLISSFLFFQKLFELFACGPLACYDKPHNISSREVLFIYYGWKIWNEKNSVRTFPDWQNDRQCMAVALELTSKDCVLRHGTVFPWWVLYFTILTLHMLKCLSKFLLGNILNSSFPS